MIAVAAPTIMLPLKRCLAPTHRLQAGDDVVKASRETEELYNAIVKASPAGG